MIEKLINFFLFLLNRWQNREALKLGGAKRSPEWPRVRREHLKRFPACAVCGETKNQIEVHHRRMFSTNPELELDPSNLITLCESGKNGIVCHRAFGHLGSYQSINESVEEDARVWRTKISNRP